jgi:hypothetical protein
MATVQGIIRYSGTPVEKVYYSAYYKSNNGGGAGPGDGQRASQWMRAVLLTEATGLFSVALSSDIFLGAGATVSAGDQVIVIAWRDTGNTPAETPGHIYYNQRWQDGLEGDHGLGIKYDNGASAVANYENIDQMVTKVFTLGGQSWNATPGGVGGDADGDLALGLNVGPTASIGNISTTQGSPTLINRNVSVSINNTSQDNVSNKAYTWDGEIILEQCSAAHDPDGGTQTADGSPVDGTVYSFNLGTSYGQAFGTPAGGDSNDASSSTYEGPSFPDHSHTWPHVDLYSFDLTVKDDNATALTHVDTFWVKTQYRLPSLSFFNRQYVTWAQYLADPTSSNVNWSTSNDNTINDVVRLAINENNPDDEIGRIDVPSRGGVYSQFSGTKVLDGTSSYAVIETDIADSLPASAPFGFLNVVTQSGQSVRHVYEIVAKDEGANTITIDTGGSTETYTSRDWYFLSSEPGGGTDLTYNWEARVSGGLWETVGKTPAALTGVLSSGTSVTIPGIGEGAIPGWWFRVIDGPARGYYQIASVANDNQITLTGSGLQVAANAGDTWEITCRDHNLFWPQGENDALDFRVTASFTRGWPSSGTYTYESSLGPFTNTGSVDNIPPQSVVSMLPEAGASTTYTFDGQESFGTQTTWVQESTFAGVHTLNGGSSYAITDANVDTTGLRDGHAWLVLLDANDYITEVFPIIDIDLESPDVTTMTIDTLGSTTTIAAGTKFRTTNAYEIEGANTDNDIASYSWRLRSTETSQAQPTSAAEFESRFDRVDGSGTGATWSYTYSEPDDGRYACIEITTTDAEGSTHTDWIMFTVAVSKAALGGGRRRLEWD